MALLPIKDDNPLVRIRFPYVTVAIIAACVAIFLYQQMAGTEGRKLVYALGTIPSVLLGDKTLAPDLRMVPPELTLITSIFLHGGWLHLFFNMLFLWVFGDNVEDALGHWKFLLFFLLSGIAGDLAHTYASPQSTVPLIGASGAISGILGAYLVLHPRASVLVLFMNFIPMRLPAFLVLLSWIGFQFISLAASGARPDAGGTAWWAHIGGFATGIILILPFRRRLAPKTDMEEQLKQEQRDTFMVDNRRRRRSMLPDTRRHRRPWG